MDARPVQTPGITVESVDDDLCLHNPSDDQVVVLNRTAGDIWHLCDGLSTSDEIAGVLARAYSQPVDGIRAEVSTVLADLLARGYLQQREDG